MICTAQRTGSTLLCSALWATDMAGRPAEYFDPDPGIEAQWLTKLGIADDGAYAERAIRAGTTPNGVFGLKVHAHQAAALVAKLLADRDGAAGAGGGGTIEQMNALLAARLGDVRYIWLRRRNIAAQAISQYRADRTNNWFQMVGGMPGKPADAVAFDFDAIHERVQRLTKADRDWYRFFMRERLRTLVVVYEDFVRDYEKTVRGVLGYLGLDDPALRIVAPQFEKQADATSVAWEERYASTIEARRTEKRYTPIRPRKARLPGQARTALPGETLKLVALDMHSGIDLPIEPGPPTRDWMDATPHRYAYRCLPLVIANQFGWLIRGSHRVTAVWDGTERVEGVTVTIDGACPNPYAVAHFGSGILTFSIGRLFRTPPGYNLHVRGPSNWPKDGICALEGIIETDWTNATFTMNWKITRPHHPVIFEVGDPIAMIVPVPRGDIERFRPETQPIAADPASKAGFEEWSALRSTFIKALNAGEPEAVRVGWQRHYIQGVNVEETEAPDHQTSLSLAPFVDRRMAGA